MKMEMRRELKQRSKGHRFSIGNIDSVLNSSIILLVKVSSACPRNQFLLFLKVNNPVLFRSFLNNDVMG